MDLDEKVSQYRMLEIEYGQLDTLMRLRYEVMMLRTAQFELRKSSMESRLAATITVAVGGTPALWGILPENHQYRILWPIALLFCALFYVISLVCRLREQSKEVRQFESTLPPMGNQPLEDNPNYIMTMVSVFGTRLSAAREVLSEKPEEPLRRRFERAELYWIRCLDEEAGRVKKLCDKQAISENDHKRISEWIEDAKK